MISSNTIEAVKARAEITDVIGSCIKLKKEGSEFVGLCPFHNEKTPSFKVSPAKQIYKCFGCGKSGDSVSFIMEYEKKTYPESIEWLAKKYNVPIEEGGTLLSKKNYVKPVPRLQKVSDQVVEYFEKRGISNNTLLRFQISEAAEWMPKAQKEVPTICFNYFRDEELINIKFRAKDKDFKLAKDAELIFYNLDALKDVRECVIVEGEIDCLSYYESGIYNVVSVPNGAAKGSQKLQYLDNCWEYFDKLEKIIISVDNDYPGELLKEELCRRLGKEKCYTVQYPEGCKDANEVLVKYGKEAVKSLTENAKLYPLEGEITVDIMSDTVFEYYKNGYPEGVAAGIPGFDEYLTFVPGQLTMVTGIPGSGKDEFVNRIIVGLAENAGWKTGIIGFEEPSEITVTKLIEKRGRKSFGYRKDPTQRLSTREFEEGLLFVDDYFKFMNADEMDITMDGIIEKAIQMVKRYGINCLVISPYNCIEHKIPRGYSETQYVSEILGKLISFLRKHQVHCFFIAHPTKIQKDKSSGEYEIPTLYNISGSANFFNKTHNGISIYRYFETNVVKVYIQKIKWSWLGKLGSCSFNYNTITRQYEAINSNGTIKHKPLSGSLENGHSVLPPERDSIPENSDELPF